jgi:transposase-like protein
VLVELNVVEQRYRIVLEVLEDGLPVTEVAMRHGVSRQTVYTWLRRYRESGTAGLVDRSRRPPRCAHQEVRRSATEDASVTSTRSRRQDRLNIGLTP